MNTVAPTAPLPAASDAALDSDSCVDRASADRPSADAVVGATVEKIALEAPGEYVLDIRASECLSAADLSSGVSGERGCHSL